MTFGCKVVKASKMKDKESRQKLEVAEMNLHCDILLPIKKGLNIVVLV